MARSGCIRDGLPGGERQPAPDCSVLWSQVSRACALVGAWHGGAKALLLGRLRTSVSDIGPNDLLPSSG